MPASTYQVFALKYAERDGRRPDHFVGGDPHDVPMPMDYFIWVIRNEERLLLVDTGFDEPVAAKRGRRLVRRPTAALDLLGIAAQGVRELVITHLHNDHVGTFFDFPARFSMCRTAKWRTSPAATWRTSACAAPTRRIMRQAWCGRNRAHERIDQDTIGDRAEWTPR